MNLRTGAAALAPLVALLLVAVPACRGEGPPRAEPTPPATSHPVTPGPPSSPPVAPPPTGLPSPPVPSRRPPGPPPAPAVPPHLAGLDLEVMPTDRKVVALTFDAGANADAVASILATLRAEGVPGTFFLTGTFIESFPAATRSIVDAGHRVGNHSTTHPHFTSLSAGQVHDEVRATERALRRDFGTEPRPWFRFPYGDRDARTIAVLNDLGYVPVRWTVDTLGWQGTSGGRSVASVTARVLDTARPGQIVLMHVGSHPTDGSMLDAQALPGVIAGLRAEGYGFATLDALLSP
ncbi:MAG TPA: polysaccharide deacetylase family protein [Natronosporangium sp.]|nr:polysaccharide deacetylase family protein [Natronosporangium sp.]